ncbi:MAG: hypothetical protein AAGH43_06040 [Pseudomonadota bacterium]
MTARRPYRPSNHSEFEGFYADHCRHCAEDDAASDLQCPIILEAMSTNAPPHEWVVDPVRGPLCTAYTEDGADPAPCPDTLELFG